MSCGRSSGKREPLCQLPDFNLANPRESILAVPANGCHPVFKPQSGTRLNGRAKRQKMGNLRMFSSACQLTSVTPDQSLPGLLISRKDAKVKGFRGLKSKDAFLCALAPLREATHCQSTERVPGLTQRRQGAKVQGFRGF